MVTGGSITTRVQWNGTCWIVGGGVNGNHVLSTSSDGLVWNNLIVNGLDSAWKDIKTSSMNGITVALTSNGTVYYSTNNQLNQWSNSTLGLSGVVGNVLGWNYENFLVGSDNGSIYTSPNGILWKPASQSGNNLNTIYGFVNNRSQEANTTIRSVIVASGLDNHGKGTIGYSYDGIYWNSSAFNGLNNVVNKVAYNGYQWVAVGSGSNGWVATSNDGIHWNNVNNTFMQEGYDVVWNGTVFVAIGVHYGNSISAYSSDGKTWTGSVLNLNGGIMGSLTWTGKIWIGYCSGSSVSTTYVSSDIYGLVWNVSQIHNMYLMDASSVFMGGYCSESDIPLSGVIDISSSVVGKPYQVFDGLYQNTDLSWNTSNNYIIDNGNNHGYGGLISTTYSHGNVSGTVSGDWVSVQLDTSYYVLYYYVSVDLTNLGKIPSEWMVLGSNDNQSWELLDHFNWESNGMNSPPNCDGQKGFMIIPRNISGVQAYSSYRLVFMSIFGGVGVSNGSILEWDLCTANPSTYLVPRYARPTVLANGIMLFPNGCYSGKGNKIMLNLLTDVYGNWIQDYNTQGRPSDITCANSLMVNLSSYPLTSHSFDGTNLIITGLNGELIYLDNLIDGMYWRNRVNGNVINTGLSYIYDSCSVGSRICLAGSGSGVITYNTIESNEHVWNSSINASSIFSAVYSIVSNSGNGPVSTPNSVLLESGSKITVLGPKYYDSGVDQSVSITLSLKPV